MSRSLFGVVAALFVGAVTYVGVFVLGLDPLFLILAISLLSLLFFGFLLIRRTTVAVQEGRDQVK